MWDDMNPSSIYGLNAAAAPAAANTNTSPGIAVSAGPSLLRNAAAYTPNSPVFWIGALALLTVGAIGVAGSSSGSIRIGKARFHAGGSAGAGKA